MEIGPSSRLCGPLSEVGAKSLTYDRTLVVGRRLVASFGHGHCDDPVRPVAHEFDIDADRA